MVKISGLPNQPTPTTSDKIPVVSGGTTDYELISDLITLIFNNIPAGAHSDVTRGAESIANNVASGGVWSGDNVGVNKNASMTAMIVYINGRRISVAAVTARVFTASKDTYVDVLDNLDGTGTLVYTEVTNNAAAPALAANSVRIAIIVTGATTIAAATSVNQGQGSALLPTNAHGGDSLGNFIFPRGAASAAKTQNPAKFSVYRNTALTPGADVNILFDTIDFDTGTNYATGTGKFTAPVAGFYQFNACVGVNGTPASFFMAALVKNTTVWKYGDTANSGAQANPQGNVSDIIQLAAGDTVSVQAHMGSSVALAATRQQTYFSGYLVSET